MHKPRIFYCGNLVLVMEDSLIQKFGPLIGVFGFVIIVTTVLALYSGKMAFMEVGKIFMGIFFLTFGGFKAYNLEGFKEAFKTYDVLAEKSNLYSSAYPFIELSLGVFYMFIAFFTSSLALQVFTHATALLVMKIGALGVLNALREGRDLQCACLGNVFNVPMTKVTLFEDILMATMAFLMLLTLFI